MKKIIISVLLALVLSLGAVSALAFDDMPNDWSKAALQSAVDNGLLQGTNNKLLPKDNLTRAQMATILVRALGATETADISQFKDVSEKSWYYTYMATSYKMGLFKGDGAGKMNPDANITRQEAFVVLARAFKLSTTDSSVLSKFKDGNKVAAWAQPELSALVANGYVGGSNGMLNPLASITRAEFAQVMYNLNKAYVDDANELKSLGTVNGNVIIRSKDMTTIENLTVNGDVIIGDGMTALTTFKNVKISGRLVIRCPRKLTFDGEAKEIVIASEGASVNKPSTPTDPVTPSNPKPNPDPEVEEDIWTDFH